jgi:hypothetical protein
MTRARSLFTHLRHLSVLLVGGGALLPAPLVAGETPALSFEKVFDTRGEPASLNYSVRFFAAGIEHHLEVWREGDRRLRRRTDESVEIHATRAPGAADFDLSVLDLKKRIHTRIERTNLYRIGNFTDWFDLAHGLRHPKGAFELVHGNAPAQAPAPWGKCDWFDLVEGSRTTHVCWSARVRLPLLLVDSSGKLQWQITAVQTTALPRDTFRIEDRGFVRNDANQDIAGD